MYTFIAYKPNSDDYCRNCHMASYSSDFFSMVTPYRQDLIEIWSDYLLKNLELKANERGYDFGIMSGNATYGSLIERRDYEEQSEVDELQTQTALDDICRAESDANLLAKDKFERKKREFEEKQKKANEEARIASLNARKKLYDDLKKEFE